MAIGIRDGRYDGDLLTADKESSLRQAGIDFTVPPVRTTVSRLPLEGERSILRIDVPPSEHVHETVNGEAYLRVGDESKKLTYSQRRELDYDRGSAQFEYEPAIDATIEDLDPDELTEYRESIGATGDDRTTLQARSLLRRDGTLTQASVLLLGKRPRDWLPQAHVRVTRFSDDISDLPDASPISLSCPRTPGSRALSMPSCTAATRSGGVIHWDGKSPRGPRATWSLP